MFDSVISELDHLKDPKDYVHVLLIIYPKQVILYISEFDHFKDPKDYVQFQRLKRKWLNHVATCIIVCTFDLVRYNILKYTWRGSFNSIPDHHTATEHCQRCENTLDATFDQNLLRIFIVLNLSKYLTSNFNVNLISPNVLHSYC